jgi:hypothetical protein
MNSVRIIGIWASVSLMIILLQVMVTVFVIQPGPVTSAELQPYSRVVDSSMENKTGTQTNSNSTRITKTKPGEFIDFFERRLKNNVWGRNDGESLTSGIYVNPDKSFGYHWNRQTPQIKPGQTYVQPLYPSVMVGGSPWEASNSEHFPVQLSQIESLELNVSHKYLDVPTGRYNFAYDIFLSDTNKPSANPKPNAEVMIWLHGTSGEPKNTYKGTFSDGHNDFDLYSWKMADGRLYYSFVMKTAPQNQTKYYVNAKRLIDVLHLNSNWNIFGIELGNEIWNGSGSIEISDFYVVMNGHTI